MSAHRRLSTVAGLFVAVTALFYAETSPSLAAQPAPKTSVSEESTTMTVYIGTYTSGKSKGIYQLSLDTLSGKLTQMGVTSGVKNPSFLAIHPSQKYLYAVSEVASVEGKKTGAVSAFAIHPKTGALKSLNWQSTGGGGPCHVVVDHSGQAVLVANYGGGSVASLPIGKHGRLKPAASFIQHKGASVNPQRQKGPHAHSINVDPKNRFAVVADLGLDKVFVYKFDAGKGTLTPNDPPSTSVAPGSGPRHFAFHPNGRYAYADGHGVQVGCRKGSADGIADDPDREKSEAGILDGGSAGASVGPISVRLKSWGQQHRHLPHRSAVRQTHRHWTGIHAGKNAAKLRHRPDRTISAGCKPIDA